MQDVKEAVIYNIKDTLESILKLLKSLIPKKKSHSYPSNERFSKRESLPDSGLNGSIDFHSDFLTNEFEDFFNNSAANIFCFDNNDFPKIENSISTVSQLELLYHLVSKDELCKKLNTIVKFALSDYCFELNHTKIFARGDMLKCREYEDAPPLWFRIVDVGTRNKGNKLSIQFLSRDKSYINTEITNAFLLRNNPEFIMRYFIAEDINPFKEKSFEEPFWGDEERNDFWDDLSIPKTQFKDYSFLRILDQMVAPDSGFHAFRNLDNNLVDIKPRLKNFIDIIGQDIIKEKISLLEKNMQNLSDTELCRASIFRQNDIVTQEENPEDIYIVKSQNTNSYDVTIFNILNNEDEITLSQSQLLKENPQYFLRLQNQVKDEEINHEINNS